MSIHPTAIVDENASIGKDVTIGAFAYIGPDVTIGDHSRIHHHATIEGYTTLGSNCEVFPQAVVGMPPQDIKFKGEKTTLEIGDNNIIREMVTIHPGTENGGGVTKIGNDNLLLIGVHVAHDCMIGNRCIIANYVQLAGHVHVEDNVNMGGHSAVHHFVTIGRHAFVGGMTRVSSDVPPYMVIVAARGTRAEVRMVNGVGLERCGFSTEEIASLRLSYMRLYSRRARISGIPLTERVEGLLNDESSNEHVEYLCRFLMRSFAHGRNGRYLEALRNDPVHRNSWKPEATHNLTINVNGDGVVKRNIASSMNPRVEVFELTAKARQGFKFAGWNGDMCSESNPITVALDSDKTVTANFVEA